jgi:hypothetical protein
LSYQQWSSPGFERFWSCAYFVSGWDFSVQVCKEEAEDKEDVRHGAETFVCQKIWVKSPATSTLKKGQKSPFQSMQIEG